MFVKYSNNKQKVKKLLRKEKQYINIIKLVNIFYVVKKNILNNITQKIKKSINLK